MRTDFLLNLSGKFTCSYKRMTKIIVVLKFAMILFLLICLGVHVRGVLSPFSDEPMWSHIVHLVSYTCCLICVIRPFPMAIVAYTIGAIYPFIYHARCVWTQHELYHRWSPICILVVVLMPAGMIVVAGRKRAV